MYGRECLVSDEELMINVWEKNNFCFFVQCLWQVIQSLKFCLYQVGVESVLIICVKCVGYYINNVYVVEIYLYKLLGMMNYINILFVDMNKFLVCS